MTPVDNSTHGSASVAKSNPPSVGHRWSSLTSDPRMKSSAVLLYKQWARAVWFVHPFWSCPASRLELEMFTARLATISRRVTEKHRRPRYYGKAQVVIGQGHRGFKRDFQSVPEHSRRSLIIRGELEGICLGVSYVIGSSLIDILVREWGKVLKFDVSG